METVKIERFKILPSFNQEGLSLIDVEATYRHWGPNWKIIANVSTGNKYLDQKIMDSIFEDINTNPEYLKLLNTPDIKEGD